LSHPLDAFWGGFQPTYPRHPSLVSSGIFTPAIFALIGIDPFMKTKFTTIHITYSSNGESTKQEISWA
jgi:hypothetical protein